MRNAKRRAKAIGQKLLICFGASKPYLPLRNYCDNAVEFGVDIEAGSVHCIVFAHDDGREGVRLELSGVSEESAMAVIEYLKELKP